MLLSFQTLVLEERQVDGRSFKQILFSGTSVLHLKNILSCCVSSGDFSIVVKDL